MWRIGWLLLILLIGGSAAQAQDEEPDPVVAFVDDNRLQAASVTDVGPDGLSRLADVFRALGATTRTLNLDEPVPAEVTHVVLAGPRRAIPLDALGYLWDFLANGGHMLLALDPNGFNGVNAERNAGGLDVLLTREYGTGVEDGVAIYPWFDQTVLEDLDRAWVLTYGENFATHPIVAPHVAYGMPVQTWGPRALTVEAFTGFGEGYALLYSDEAYGETGPLNQPVERNIGVDLQGRLVLAAIAQNRQTGSRVALLGDSEMVQNRYGYEYIQTTQLPLYPGNAVFMDRLAGWLLGLPPEAWPALPDFFTWVAVDGRLDDWTGNATVAEDSLFDSAGGPNLREVRLFQNGQFLYMGLTTSAPPQPDAVITLVSRYQDEQYTLTVSAEGASVADVNGTTEAVPDLALALGDVYEMRVPLRVTGTLRVGGQVPTVERLCIRIGDAEDCLDTPVQPNEVQEFDPATVRFPPGPTAIISTVDGGANLRAGPNTAADRIIYLFDGNLMQVFGRDESAQWVLLKNGRFSGWMNVRLVDLNVPVESLVIVSG